MIIGTIISCDKTTISVMASGRMAHPLLISMANISMDFWNKASNHCYLLLALLPVPTFICSNTKICGILEACLVHKCLDEILQPLKDAARFGVMDQVGRGEGCGRSTGKRTEADWKSWSDRKGNRGNWSLYSDWRYRGKHLSIYTNYVFHMEQVWRDREWRS